MLARPDTVRALFEFKSTGEEIDTLRVAEFLVLMIRFFQLAIQIMQIVLAVIGALDVLAAGFWAAWDTFVIGLRWKFCPVRVAPIG